MRVFDEIRASRKLSIRNGDGEIIDNHQYGQTDVHGAILDRMLTEQILHHMGCINLVNYAG